MGIIDNIIQSQLTSIDLAEYTTGHYVDENDLV